MMNNNADSTNNSPFLTSLFIQFSFPFYLHVNKPFSFYWIIDHQDVNFFLVSPSRAWHFDFQVNNFWLDSKHKLCLHFIFPTDESNFKNTSVQLIRNFKEIKFYDYIFNDIFSFIDGLIDGSGDAIPITFWTQHENVFSRKYHFIHSFIPNRIIV